MGNSIKDKLYWEAVQEKYSQLIVLQECMEQLAAIGRPEILKRNCEITKFELLPEEKVINERIRQALRELFQL